MGEETTYGLGNFIRDPTASHHGVCGGCHPLRVDLGCKSAAKRGCRREGSTLRGRVLLQGEVGTCRGVSDAFQEKSYPVLKKEMELGRMLKVSMVTPRYHMTEDSRWDYRVTIVFKNAAIANDNFDSSGIIKQLYPDQETYKKEEQRRFQILDAHWDLPIKDVDLD